jgi:hypothetical protein
MRDPLTAASFIFCGYENGLFQSVRVDREEETYTGHVS